MMHFTIQCMVCVPVHVPGIFHDIVDALSRNKANNMHLLSHRHQNSMFRNRCTDCWCQRDWTGIPSLDSIVSQLTAHGLQNLPGECARQAMTVSVLSAV